MASTPDTDNQQCGSKTIFTSSPVFHELNAKALTLQAKVTKLENIAIEKEGYVSELLAELNNERSKRIKAESSVTKLRKFVMEQNNYITQIVSATESNIVSEYFPEVLTGSNFSDAPALENLFQNIISKLAEFSMDQYQLQLEVEQIYAKVFELLVTTELVNGTQSKNSTETKSLPNPDIYLSKEIGSAPIVDTTRPKRKSVRPTRLIDELSSKNQTVNKDSKVTEQTQEEHKISGKCENQEKRGIKTGHCDTVPNKTKQSDIAKSRLRPKKQISKCQPSRKYFKKHKGFTNLHGQDLSKPLGYFCLCGVAQFKTLKYLQSHISYFTKEKGFSCKFCPKRFHGASFLRAHLRQTHKGKSETYASKYKHSKCGKFYKSKSKRHLMQPRSKPCGISENQEKDVGKQTRRKTVPNKTNQTSIRKSRKQNKQQIHTKQETRKYFKSHPGSKKQHGIDFSKALGYYCLCGVAPFKRLFYLKNHINYFTREKVFSCKLCPKRFHAANFLRAHLHKIHKVQPAAYTSKYGCSKCGTFCDSKDQYSLHRVQCQKAASS